MANKFQHDLDYQILLKNSDNRHNTIISQPFSIMLKNRCWFQLALLFTYVFEMLATS